MKNPMIWVKICNIDGHIEYGEYVEFDEYDYMSLDSSFPGSDIY